MTAENGAMWWAQWAPGHRELGKGLQNHSKVEERAQTWDNKMRAVLSPLSVNQQLPEAAPAWENIGERAVVWNWWWSFGCIIDNFTCHYMNIQQRAFLQALINVIC